MFTWKRCNLGQCVTVYKQKEKNSKIIKSPSSLLYKLNVYFQLSVYSNGKITLRLTSHFSQIKSEKEIYYHIP